MTYPTRRKQTTSYSPCFEGPWSGVGKIDRIDCLVENNLREKQAMRDNTGAVKDITVGAATVELGFTKKSYEHAKQEYREARLAYNKAVGRAKARDEREAKKYTYMGNGKVMTAAELTDQLETAEILLWDRYPGATQEQITRLAKLEAKAPVKPAPVKAGPTPEQLLRVAELENENLKMRFAAKRAA